MAFLHAMDDSADEASTGVASTDVDKVVNTVDAIGSSQYLTSIEAPSITVDYYRQMVGSNDEVYSLDPSRTNVYQTYTEIKDLEIILQAPLENSLEGDLDLVGKALFYPGMVPNPYDVFIHRLVDGRRVLMQVENDIEVRSSYGSAMREASISSMVIGESPMYADLESKITRRLQFVKERFQYGLPPIISSAHYTNRIAMIKEMEKIEKVFLGTFYHKEMNTCILNCGDYLYYDPRMMAVLPPQMTSKRGKNTMPIRLDNVEKMDTESLWDALMRGDDAFLFSGVRDIYWQSIAELGRLGRFPPIHIDSDIYVPMTETGSPPSALGMEVSVSVLPSPWVNDTYVLSEAFYNSDHESFSDIEYLVDQHIHRLRLDVSKINTVMDEIYTLSDADKYYYLPIMYLLLRMESRL